MMSATSIAFDALLNNLKTCMINFSKVVFVFQFRIGNLRKSGDYTLVFILIFLPFEHRKRKTRTEYTAH